MNGTNLRQTNLKLTLSKAVNDLSFGLIFAILIALGKNISIPFYPIPFTLQTLFIALICLFSGSRKQIIYGLTIFLAYNIFNTATLVIPTLGYLIGFFIMGYILTKPNFKQNSITLAKSVFLSQMIVLFSGTLWLSVITGSFMKAFQCGFLFFIPAEVIKCLAVIFIFKVFNKTNFSFMER